MNDSIILRATSRLLLPLLLVFALLLLFRGHHEPGGGFVAGLTAAGAMALYRMAHGSVSYTRILRFRPAIAVALGLFLALGAASVTSFAGQPFLTAGWLPAAGGDGSVGVGTPLVFDVGVALVVVGFALLTLDALESYGDE